MPRLSDLPQQSPATIAALKAVAGVTALEATVSQVSTVANAANVADKVTQAGSATIAFTLAASSHYAYQAQRFTGGIAAIDVASTPGFNATAFATPHATGTANTTIGVDHLGSWRLRCGLVRFCDRSVLIPVNNIAPCLRAGSLCRVRSVRFFIPVLFMY